jgi:hypothetical protein
MTWVSNEPWGYAPYHYGRWAFVGDRWYWVPDSVNTTPVYSPALVAFVPYGNNDIGWVPLGPGDAYVARYYDQNWQPHYLTRGDVIATNLVNWTVPNAVTVVPIDYFDRPIDARYVRHVNPGAIAQVRPTLEPLLLTPLRNAALRSAWGRGKIDLPPGIAKKLQDTTVVVGTAPVVPPFRKDLDKAMRVERIADKAKNQKLNVRDERNVGASSVDVRSNEQPKAVSRDAFRGSGVTGRELHKQEQQQRNIERAQQKIEPKSVPRAEGGRVGNPAKGRPEFKGPPVREAPKPQIQRGPPVREAPKPQIQRGPPASAPAKQQVKQPPGQSKAPGGGGGKGKSKKP